MTFGQLPARWSIASCLFPYEEDPGRPGPGPHPVLIAGVIPERGIVLAAYGTGQTDVALAAKGVEPYQIQIDPTGHRYLRYVTRFDFRKAVPIEWGSEWFKPIAANVPVIMGKLHPAQIVAANKAFEACKSMLASGALSPWGQQVGIEPKSIQLTAQPATVIYRRRGGLGGVDEGPSE